MTTITPVRTPGDADTLWRNADFLKFWSGETLSLFGTQVTNLALPLTAILSFHAGAGMVGVLRFLQLVPYLVLALVFGALADRMRRKRVMMVANAARMLLVGAIPVLSATGALTLPLLLTLACAIGVFSVLFDVSWMSFVPTLVGDPARYLEANQKTGVTASSADVAGPGLAGAIIGALTAPIALAVDAASYAVSLATLLWIRTPEPKPAGADADAGASAGKRRSIPGEIAEGLRFVLGHRLLRSLALIGPFTNFSMVSVWTMFLVYASRDRGLSPGLIGVVFSVSSIGGLIGAALSRKLLARLPLGPVWAVSMSALFAGPLLIAVAGGPRAAVFGCFTAAFFVSYLGLGVANVVGVSLRMNATPPQLRGRMTAAFRTLLFGGGSLGGLLGGLLAQTLGAHTAITAVAIGSAVMLLPVALSPVSRLRDLP
ncbi:MFS family permease [Catenulispora sp. GP43]|uniref:MFS transporter n=1 Tax=Catenulispora sp. GP43 TaxID=3156263 RepID=UPI0035156B0F